MSKLGISSLIQFQYKLNNHWLEAIAKEMLSKDIIMRKNYKKQEVQQLKKLDEYLIIYKKNII
jgi:hypothetical protein